MGKRISSLGEFRLIDVLAVEAASTLLPGALGIGDDCAVLPPGADGRSRLFSVDAYIEDIHFRRSFSTPHDIGWKAVGAALSDIAAMGGEAEGILVALLAPEDLEVETARGLYRGMCDIAVYCGIPLLGGDTVRASQLGLSISVSGWCEGRPVLRSGAQPGDTLWVSGRIGAAARGLKLLESGMADEQRDAEVLRAHRRPEPRLALGRELQRAGLAKAMIDVSDGLLQDLGHLLRASGAGAELFAEKLPNLSDGSLEELLEDVCGGDDYELLFAAGPEAGAQLPAWAAERGLPELSCIGRIIETPHSLQMVLYDGSSKDIDELLKERPNLRRGYSHFGDGDEP